MFQFPRCPLGDCSPSARPCAGRVAPFGHPRIAGCQRLPGAFRRVAASFLGRQRQGIHHAPILRISCVAAPPVPSWPRPQTGTRQRDGPAWPHPLPRRHDASWDSVCVCFSCVFRVCLCMVLVSARGRADTNPCRPTRTGATAGSDPVRPRPGLTASRGRRTRRVPRGALSRCTTRRSADPKVGVRSSNLVRSRLPTSEEISQPIRGLRTAPRSPDRNWHDDGGASADPAPGYPRWSRGDSNPGPPPCKGGALPAKLRPPTAASRRSRIAASRSRSTRPDRWARLDSNQGPRPYQGRALTA
jgi:hypothetical protein